VIRLAPEDARGWRNRGMMYLLQDEWAKGIADYDQAIRFDPNDAYSYNNRGIARAAKKDREGAIADFRKALALRPDMQQTRERLQELGATP